MRAIIVRESLRGGVLPREVQEGQIREYSHALGGKQRVTIIESDVSWDSAPHIALELAARLLDRKFYAHIVDGERMLISFPRTVVEVRRGEEAAQKVAQRIGTLFSIPLQQMQFLAMFDEDHPDNPNGHK